MWLHSNFRLFFINIMSKVILFSLVHKVSNKDTEVIIKYVFIQRFIAFNKHYRNGLLISLPWIYIKKLNNCSFIQYSITMTYVLDNEECFEKLWIKQMLWTKKKNSHSIFFVQTKCSKRRKNQTNKISELPDFSFFLFSKRRYQLLSVWFIQNNDRYETLWQ